MRNPRGLVALGAALCTLSIARPVEAQLSFATFGGVEFDGSDSQLALLGTAISKSGKGWSPVLTIMGMVGRNDFGTETKTTTSFAPSLGIQYTTAVSNWSISGGYSFTNSDVTAAGFGVIRTGGENTPFVTGQYNYWGNGTHFGEAIASFATTPQYLWSRGRAGFQLGTSNTSLGGEVVLQGTSKNTSAWIIQAGPLLRYKASKALSFDLSGGLYQLTGDNSDTKFYIAADFLLLTPSP